MTMTTRTTLLVACALTVPLTVLAGTASAGNHRNTAVAAAAGKEADDNATLPVAKARAAREAKDARDTKTAPEGVRRNVASSGSAERDGDPYAVPLFKDAAQLH